VRDYIKEKKNIRGDETTRNGLFPSVVRLK
jgi:hypothetical protein